MFSLKKVKRICEQPEQLAVHAQFLASRRCKKTDTYTHPHYLPPRPICTFHSFYKQLKKCRMRQSELHRTIQQCAKLSALIQTKEMTNPMLWYENISLPNNQSNDCIHWAKTSTRSIILQTMSTPCKEESFLSIHAEALSEGRCLKQNDGICFLSIPTPIMHSLSKWLLI